MIMKTRLTLLGTLAISLMGFTAQAQKAFYGTVKGKIAAQDKPVEAASVALLKAADSSIFKTGQIPFISKSCRAYYLLWKDF